MTPDEHTNQEFFLEVGDSHQLYIHDWGNQAASVPILFLHGGPGNGCDDSDKQKFDPATQRVIFHDQRGAGKSLPHGLLEHNTTEHLISDIVSLLDKLSLTKCVIVGGSWGSTLALTFGIAHPDRVHAMVIDGVFTATQAEDDWLEKGGWRSFFPEVWEAYTQTVPEAHRDNPSAYHFERAFGDDAEQAKKSSYAYLSMELALLKLDDHYSPDPYDKYDPTNGLIEMHYLRNRCFLEPDYILTQAQQLTMPIHIIQGRYDMVCPPMSAYNLHKALPSSTFTWTINGHLRQHEAKNIQKLRITQSIEAV